MRMFRTNLLSWLVGGMVAAFLGMMLSACSTNLTDQQIARIDQAVLTQPALAGDIDTTDAYTTQTECGILGGVWTPGAGPGGYPGMTFDGCVYPYSDFDYDALIRKPN